MKKSTFKKAICLVSLISLIVFNYSVKASANSAQWHWTGVSSTGAVVVDEDCPIEVTKEILTFDICEFPSNYYNSAEDYLAYTPSVTAQYTFYNP